MDSPSGLGHADEQKSMDASTAQAPTLGSPTTNLGISQDAQESQEGSSGTTFHESQSENTTQVSPEMEEDALMTPRVRNWSSARSSLNFSPSNAVDDATRPQIAQAGAHDGSQAEEYFPPSAPWTSYVTDFAKGPSTSAGVADSASAHISESPSLSSLSTSSEHVSVSTDAPAEIVLGPTYNPESTRPTSVPNFQSASLSRRRDISDYPQYPNQSFAALQKHPAHPHPLRTRTSNPRHELSSTSSNASFASFLPHVPSGARTTGNTPAQSPGLFSPTFGKKTATESDDGGYNTPLLHPTHLQAPKETHILVKNTNPNTGRKHINQYELRERLGSGQHGTVKLAVNLDNSERFAVKIVRRFSKKVRLGRAGDPNDMIKKEVAILKKARHAHVVSLYEVVDDEEFAKVYLILEYVERGEIVWRKTTERHVALFEKARLAREKAGFFDEVYESALVEEFNSKVPQKREERARLLEEQSREASQRVETRRHRRNHSVASPFWSLEYGGDAEHDFITESSPPQSRVGSDTRLSRADLHAAETAHCSQQESPTPVQTPRSHPYPTGLEQLSSSQPGSRPDSPSIQDGSAYGGFSEDSQVSDIDFQSTLEQIIAQQSQWSGDEEEYRHVPCLTMDQALKAFRDTVLGLEYLHFQGIMHRDIKPANLLWTSDYRVKISDFGVSYLGKPVREDTNNEELPEADTAVVDEDLELAKTVGTPAFYAPELCDPDLFDSSKTIQRPAITGQIDVWALGVTLYGMIFGRLPFYDPNEFQMYEKIARDEVFIPRMRLKGVEHTDKLTAHYDEKPEGKRFDDVLEYDEVADTLHDLIKRLLIKDPSKRISLKEVKHHPWVIDGIEDREAWLDQNDPAVQSQGKKIEPSKEEVQDAVVGLTIVDRVKMGVQRIGSVLRGRGSRKRTDSNPKSSDAPGTALFSRTKDEWRSSVAGSEAIYASLKASREPSEHHPLSQSVAASPEAKQGDQYFGDDVSPSRSETAPEVKDMPRPVLVDRALSTADSMKTIRAPVPISPRDSVSAPATSAGEVFSNLTPFVESNSQNTTTLGNILNAPGRFMNTMRSRERGPGRSSPSQSSRASSVDPTTREDLHASPSLAMSTAIAPGHVDQPPILRDEANVRTSRSSNASSTEAFEQAQTTGSRRQTLAQASSITHRRSISHATGLTSPPSPDDILFFGGRQRPASVAESSSGFPANAAVSSSSDMIFSGDSAAHSRIPSVVSGASSLSMPMTSEEDALDQRATLEKANSPFTISERSGSSIAAASPTNTSLMGGNVNPSLAQAQLAEEEAAGYNGEPEEESESDDEGLAMA